MLGRLRRNARTLWLFSDWRSRARYIRLRVRPGHGPPVPLRLRPLGGAPLWVRPGTSDVAVIFEDYVGGFHEPPEEVRGGQLDCIVELGTNIGAGLAALAASNPAATLLGVEADPDNAALARRNVSHFGERCRVLNAAAWHEPGELVVDRAEGRATGFVVRPVGELERGTATVPARTVGQILDELGPDRLVDYLYLDVEGAHAGLLTGDAAWATRVRSIKVSAHHATSYSEADCARDLERLGFTARVIPLDPTGWTVGVRDVAA
jgi:FkbM family methyltransferase